MCFSCDVLLSGDIMNITKAGAHREGKMLEVKNIFKSFKDKPVLRGVSLEIDRGEVYGLIGKNGAGKTTLMNIISQILSADSGEVWIDGKQILSQNDLSGKLGYILDIPCGFEYLTAYEYLDFLLIPQNLSKEEVERKVDEILNLVNLSDVKNKKIKSFSRGMKQRMGIASGLIFDPEIVILDEPSSALDPEGRFEVLKIIEKLKEQNKVVMLSTHILNDVERVCDKIGIINNGVIAISGKTQDVLEEHTKDAIIIELPKGEQQKLVAGFEGVKEVVSISKTQLGVRVEFMPGCSSKVMKKALSLSDNISSIQIEKATIEEIFMNLNKGDKRNV